MAIASENDPSILFLGIMFRDSSLRDEALALFQKKFGTVLSSVEPRSFSQFSTYYDSEIGGEVQKEYFLFDEKIDRDQLAEIKLFTNDLEAKFLVGGKRLINLDPGYLTKDKFVLASAKDFAHRISIGKGIFAEVTLHFHHGKVRFFSWTYRDYIQPDVETFLLEGRKQL